MPPGRLSAAERPVTQQQPVDLTGPHIMSVLSDLWKSFLFYAVISKSRRPGRRLNVRHHSSVDVCLSVCPPSSCL